jgi:hypothetical protein
LNPLLGKGVGGGDNIELASSSPSRDCDLSSASLDAPGIIISGVDLGLFLTSSLKILRLSSIGLHVNPGFSRDVRV